MFFNWWIDNENTVHTYNRMSVINKNEIYRRIGGAGYNHFEWDNADQERQMPYVLSSDSWILKFKVAIKDIKILRGQSMVTVWDDVSGAKRETGIMEQKILN